MENYRKSGTSKYLYNTAKKKRRSEYGTSTWYNESVNNLEAAVWYWK
jgi:hypothetical protein